MISDERMLKVAIQTLQMSIRALPRDERAGRQARLFVELASLSKRFMLAKESFEDLLTLEGVQEVSKAIYALEWEQLYYQLETQRQARLKFGYFKRLWWALLNKEVLPL